MNATRMTRAGTAVLIIGVFAGIDSGTPEARWPGVAIAGEPDAEPQALARAADQDTRHGAASPDNSGTNCPIDDPDHCQRDTGGFMALIDPAATPAYRWADDFRAGTSGQIDAICWWPGFKASTYECSAPGETPPDNWYVNFYDDAGGLPGALIGAPDLAVNVTGKIWNGGTSRVWQYSGNLMGAGPGVTAGECYWIQITGLGEGLGGCSVYWATSLDGNLYNFSDENGVYEPAGFRTVGNPLPLLEDLAFCVDVGLEPGSCGQITGTCCMPPPQPCEDDVSPLDCAAAGGMYVPGAVTCATPFVCPGACEAEDCTDAVDLNAEVCSGGLPCARPFNNHSCDEMIVQTTCRVNPTGPPTQFNDFGSDTWFSYTTADDECGDIRIDTCENGTYDGFVAVYNVGPTCGCPADISEPTDCGDDNCGVSGGMGTALVRDVEAGDCLMIRVGGWAGDQGEGELVVSVEQSGACSDGPARPNPEEWNAPARTACMPGTCSITTSQSCERDRDCPADETCDSPCINDAFCVPAPDGSFPGVCYTPKNRYLSVAPNPANAGMLTARRIRLDTGAAPVVLGWMGPPDADGLVRIVDEASRHYMDWSTAAFPIWCARDAHCPNQDCDVESRTCQTGSTDVVQMGDCATSPAHTYLIESIVQGAPISNPVNYSAPLSLSTVDNWGDVMGPIIDGVPLPPDGSATFNDILAVVKGFQSLGAPTSWLDLEPEVPNYDVGFPDVLSAVKGFQTQPYPHDDPCTCAGQPPCP